MSGQCIALYLCIDLYSNCNLTILVLWSQHNFCISVLASASSTYTSSSTSQNVRNLDRTCTVPICRSSSCWVWCGTLHAWRVWCLPRGNVKVSRVDWHGCIALVHIPSSVTASTSVLSTAMWWTCSASLNCVYFLGLLYRPSDSAPSSWVWHFSMLCSNFIYSSHNFLVIQSHTALLVVSDQLYIRLQSHWLAAFWLKMCDVTFHQLLWLKVFIKLFCHFLNTFLSSSFANVSSFANTFMYCFPVWYSNSDTFGLPSIPSWPLARK